MVHPALIRSRTQFIASETPGCDWATIGAREAVPPWVFHHPLRRRHAEAGDRFFNLQKSLKAAVAQVGVDSRWRVHDLRHRRCITWLAAGKPPAKVQKALGHASLATTMKYAHLVRDDLRTLVDDEAAAVG